MSLDVEGTVRALSLMLFGGALLCMLSSRLHIPYAVLLVLGGLLFDETGLLVLPQLDPRVLLFVFLPPLLFDAAFRLDDSELRTVIRPVALLAVPGTIATAAIVAVVLVLALQLPWTVALLFGSIVAATDPIAVVAAFSSIGAPTRLAVVAEAESLINDGVAVTLYTVALDLAIAGSTDVPGAFTLFTGEIVGGVAVGVALGLAISQLTATARDRLVEMALTTALAYGSYLVATSLHTSGVLACVTAGLIQGSYGRRVSVSEHARAAQEELWEFFGFVANALVFLLVGITASLAALVAAAGPVLMSIVAVIGARAVLILGPAVWIRGWLSMSGAERAVLVWGGLRGALTIALALAIPREVTQRELLIAMAFGVVLFTLLVQGITLAPVVQRAGLARRA